MKPYEVGQVLFIALSKKPQVYPMRVVETITKKTLQGEEVQYKLAGGVNPPQFVMLDEIDGEVFDSAETARSVLLKRASDQVNKIVNAAILKSKEWYGHTHRDVQAIASTMEDLPDLTGDATDDADGEPGTIASVRLPDGSITKVKIPAMST